MSAPLFGAAYYPEHWDRARWPIDAKLMQRAGINIVRLAEFAWSRLEPREGSFDFGWLDEALDVLMAHGIRAVLGTPTAAPPAWLIQAHPEILPVNEDGQQAGFGMRRHYCPTQPAFLAATRRIVEAMASHYQQHPSVLAWQIDNELGNIANGTRCHCESCRAAFQQWLRQRYVSLEQLNACWGTVFWSQEYTAWEQIPVPLRTIRSAGPGSAHNPALFLDFARFTSELWVRYQQFQVRILRELCSQHRLTHNFMGLFPSLDYAALARDLDVVSWDIYPRLPAPWSPTHGAWNPCRQALSHDLMRSLQGQAFWVMEQQAGASGWSTISPTPLPGEIRLWTLQSIARGAEAILYFCWRTSSIGTEQFWHGILPHDGTPGKRYEEVRRTGEEMRRLAALLPAELPAEVAILRSYPTLWAFEAQPTVMGFSYDEHIARYYQALWQRNVAVDIVTEDLSWDHYTLLIAPSLFVVSNELARRLHRWVEKGGTLVLTFRSGVKNEQNKVIGLPLPGLLRELTGIQVADYTALLPAGDREPAGGPDSLELLLDAGTYRSGAEIWMDELKVDDAVVEVMGSYRRGPFAGTPAITLKHVGAGHVIYVGTVLDDAGQALLTTKLLSEAGVHAGPSSPEQVEIVRRVHEGETYWFLLNHSTNPQEVTLPTGGIELLSGQAVSEKTTIPALDALVIRSQEDKT